MKRKKTKIMWITADWFVDHDFLLVSQIANVVDIHWIILFPLFNQRFKESDFDIIKERNKRLRITFCYIKYRQRNPMNIRDYSLINKIQELENPDVIYIDIGVDNPWSLPMYVRLPQKKTIVVLHQGVPHEGMKYRRISNVVRKIIFNRLKFVKMFSKHQALIFQKNFPHNIVFYSPLPLIGFGVATNKRPIGAPVRFLSFGTLNYAKNIDLLIDAACLLYERGVKDFRISINGACKDWSWYQRRIKYPEIFELDIRMIDNDEIPNLFNGAHYLVQPYRVVSQSGPTKIAYNYNLPVIVSNLPGFMDELEEGVNGFSFECGNVESLADRMQQLIESHATDYVPLLERMKEYTEAHYAEDALIERYKNMMEEVIMTKDEKVKRPFTIKGWLKNSRAVLFLRLIYEKVQELVVETQYLANGNRYKDERKLKTDLQIRVHAIEKGMSIGKLKEGFGNKKACDIVDDLRLFLSIGGDRQFVVEACSVLNRYVGFKEEVGQKVEDVKAKLADFMEAYHVLPLDQGGVYKLKYDEIKAKAHGSLPEVLSSRFAVRDFGSSPIDMGLLRKALQLAEKSPSACNRQSWRVHVYTGDKALTLFNLQGGGKSFAREMQAAILICGDLTSYYLNETNLPYVDGSLYGMNLMLALHYYGLASIPLTMGHKAGYLRKIKRAMGIPRNEVPVLLIGVGSYKDEFKAAVSCRYPYTQYTTFEE